MPRDEKPVPPGRRSFAKNAQDFGCGLPLPTPSREKRACWGPRDCGGCTQVFRSASELPNADLWV